MDAQRLLRKSNHASPRKSEISFSPRDPHQLGESPNRSSLEEDTGIMSPVQLSKYENLGTPTQEQDDTFEYTDEFSRYDRDDMAAKDELVVMGSSQVLSGLTQPSSRQQIHESSQFKNLSRMKHKRDAG